MKKNPSPTLEPEEPSGVVRIVKSVELSAQVGNFEGVRFRVEMELTACRRLAEASANTLGAQLFAACIKQVEADAAVYLKDFALTTVGKSPAGPLALYLQAKGSPAP